MTTAVATLANNLATKLGMGEVGNELITTLKQTAFKGQATDAQFTALMIVANQYGLNPWTREIYAFPDRNNGIVPVVGVDGWARIINEHPQFDGLEFSMPADGSECTCVIHRKDRAHPISVTEYYSECRRDNAVPWKTHPKRMLRHKALIQAARLAFGYTGIFDQDEAERILEKDITAQVNANKNQIELSPEQEAERGALVETLNKVAVTQGLTAYADIWMKLTAHERKLVGAAKHEELKKLAQKADAEVIQQEPTDVVDADFVADMEGAE